MNELKLFYITKLLRNDDHYGVSLLVENGEIEPNIVPKMFLSLIKLSGFDRLFFGYTLDDNNNHHHFKYVRELMFG